jgi:hypothetical protein
MNTMLKLVESRTTTLLSELATLTRTSSSEPSMEFKISTASGMPAGKTQTLKYVSNMLFLVQIVGAYQLVRYLLNSLGLHPVSTSRKELFGLHEVIIERDLRQGQNSTNEALKH